MGHLLMTPHAILIQNAAVVRRYHNRLREVLERKSFGMPVSIVGFRDIFGDKIVRKMAVYTGGRRMMA